MIVKYPHNLRNLNITSQSSSVYNTVGAQGKRTGSSALLVLLIVAEASLISSIIFVKSLPISSSLTESLSASL